MPARFKTKCPQCDRVTSDCMDSSLTASRTEFDGVKCGKCVRASKPKTAEIDYQADLCRLGYHSSKRTKARVFGQFAGHCGIR